MAELVCQHCTYLIRRQTGEQRQADDEIALGQPQQAEPGHLHHGGVEVGRDEHDMHRFGLDGAPHLLDLCEQGRQLDCRHASSLRRRQLEPESAREKIGECERQQSQLDQRQRFCSEQQADDEQRAADTEDGQRQDIADAQCSQQRQLHLV